MSHRAKRHIWLIEDNSADIELFRICVAEAHLDVDLTVTQRGDEAMRLVSNVQESDDRPDLIVLDLNLPVLDGFEILEEMRSRASSVRTPVLVFSSSSSPRDVAKVRLFERVHYLSKPCSLEGYMQVGELVAGLLAKASLPGVQTAPSK